MQVGSRPERVTAAFPMKRELKELFAEMEEKDAHRVTAAFPMKRELKAPTT